MQRRYAKGGPEQALSMLNTNLDLAITDYVTVDFSAIVECVDLLGGVEMTITDDEASLMLGYIQELNRLTGNTASCPVFRRNLHLKRRAGNGICTNPLRRR